MKGAGEEVDRVKGEEMGVASTMFRDGVPDAFIYYNLIVYIKKFAKLFFY